MITRAAEPARERLSLDSDWRFTRGDPEGTPASLQYDVRPVVKDAHDDKVADSKPQTAEATTAPAEAVLKPWILPTANRFIKNPAGRFARPPGEPRVPCVQPDFDDSQWQRVDLPHDWAIAGPFIPQGDGGGMGRLPTAGVGWYRKALAIPAGDAGRSIFLDVDGAMAYAAVWVNGHLVGGWPYGYASWRVDLTPFVVPGGVNQLAIRLDHPPDSSRWYPGGGLYRNVWLTKTRPVHVGQWGTRVTTAEVSATAATINLDVTLDNDGASNATVAVTTTLFAIDVDGRISGEAVGVIQSATTSVAARSSATVTGSAVIAHPRLWGPPPQQTPNRYVAVTTVAHQGQIVDRYETRFGIRTARFDANTGLSVNGQRIQIQGVNNHHDLGALGAAFNTRAAERQLELLREMGCNAIRMSHNPPAPELLELTDRMGFLVLDEVFDAWFMKKTPLDFHLIFQQWHEPDLRAMLRRDRNCPSVILWSIGNEVGEQYTAEKGAAVASELVGIVHDEDPTRPTTTAMNWAKADMPLPGVVDVISLNYQGAGIRTTPGQFPAFHAKFPNKAILSSETASALSTRGEYTFPVLPGISGPVRPGSGGDPQTHQVSDYGLYAADFGSSPDRVFASQDHNPYVAGEFVWSGFDYLGEPTPYYSSRSSYCGILDLAGFKKDRFYLYQSHWRPDFPMAHLLPHWTWPGRVGLVTPVHVFTSGDEAELFLNGHSLGRKKKGSDDYRLRWDDVIYQPGTLNVVAYRDGKPWATDTVTTASEPARLAASADRNAIVADGKDLSFITVRVTDSAGVTAPLADATIRFTLDGPGEIVATDNGDPTSFEPFPAHDRKAFHGLCLVIVRGLPQRPGTVMLHAESAGLAGASVVIQTGAPD